MDRGIHTSEFWLTLVGMVLTAALVIMGHGAEAGLLQVGTAGYAIARGNAKRPPGA